jgi:hypothetical protein
VTIRDTTQWSAGGPTRTKADGLRRWGLYLIMIGAFALIAAGAASVFSVTGLVTDLMTAAGAVACLAGWRVLVIARRRAQPARAGAR